MFTNSTCLVIVKCTTYLNTHPNPTDLPGGEKQTRFTAYLLYDLNLLISGLTIVFLI
jgi:hypothetical protein